MDKQKLSTILDAVKVEQIKSIQLRTVGLLDVFGKIIIDIEYIDDSKQSIEIQSPVPVDIITKWLDTNALLDKTVLYKF